MNGKAARQAATERAQLEDRMAEFAAGHLEDLLDLMETRLGITKEEAANEIFIQVISHAAEKLHGTHLEPLKSSVEVYRRVDAEGIDYADELLVEGPKRAQ